ncbi:MAG: hypothetical protein ACYTG6_04015 [Planctomycetota bacterium]|jgi:hypothetical protein
MKRVAFVLLAVLLTARAATGREDRLAVGEVVRRTTEAGVEYALFLPDGWRRGRSYPLILHIPPARFMPHEVLAVPYIQKELQDLSKLDGGVAVHCCALMAAHNKENVRQKEEVDPARFNLFLDRDAATLEGVIDAVAEEVSILRDAVVIRASNYAAEAALGLATRKPELFAAVLLKDTHTTTRLIREDGAQTWSILPAGEALAPALRLPVLISYDPGNPNGEARILNNGQIRDHLVSLGFRQVEIHEGVPDDSYRHWTSDPNYRRWLEIRLEQQERAACAQRRDQVLADARRYLERGSLSPALDRYRKARRLEEEHGLDPASDVLYADLEARGRAMLAENEDLPLAKKKQQYRKLIRLFAGTPLAAEIEALLAELR